MRFSQFLPVALAASSAEAAPQGSRFFRWYGKNTGARNQEGSSLESENRVLDQLRHNYHRAIKQNDTSNSTVTLTTTQTQTATLELQASELTKTTNLPADIGEGALICPTGTLFVSTTTIDITVYVTATSSDEPNTSLTTADDVKTALGERPEAISATSTLTVSLAQSSGSSAPAGSAGGQVPGLAQATTSSLSASSPSSTPSSFSAPSAFIPVGKLNSSTPALQSTSVQVSTPEPLVITTTPEAKQSVVTLSSMPTPESAPVSPAAVETPSSSSSADGTPLSSSAAIETPSPPVATPSSSTTPVETPSTLLATPSSSAVETPSSSAAETPSSSSAIETPSSSAVETASTPAVQTPSTSAVQTPSSSVVQTLSTPAAETPSSSPVIETPSSSPAPVTPSSSSIRTSTPSLIETSSPPVQTSSRPTLIWTPYVTPSATPIIPIPSPSSKTTSAFAVPTSSIVDTEPPAPTRKPGALIDIDINVPELCIDYDMTPVTASKLIQTPTFALPTPTQTICADTQETGTPQKESTHCGVNGKPAGVYFLAEFIEERSGVPVSQEGCYQFCSSVMESTDGCQSYRFYHNQLGAPRCELYGMPVSWSVDDLDQNVEDKWFDLSCGSPTVKKWKS